MEDLTKPRAAVDQIVSRLETRFRNFNISEIVKAGSLGHGTVVPGHYDIDLVLYSRDISARVVCSYNGFGNWTSQLKEFIEREFGITSYTPGYNNRSVQFKCSYKGVNLSVDLLVSPFWSNPREFYQFLESLSRERRDIFTVCASKWQIEFFKRVDSQAKEYIRRAKAWRNKYFGADVPGRPSSYLMSLLVVKAYETANRRYYGAGPREVTTELMSLVKTPLFE
ncbi:2'-5'-oligoadenylate synthase 1A [Geodia barretti]|uniref:2'-5'-oligoadenylate synthase 1A n=1 Tax=Geodia barretti TaxID=519541 RepID=A0AA35S807_GEOBA|nr:2'-5'-oligoadenylate synthase 1A [Geodia barretti]